MSARLARQTRSMYSRASGLKGQLPRTRQAFPSARGSKPFSSRTAAAASILWIIERIAFFTLIREKGAVYTIQAIYVSTPAAVLWAILIFGKPADPWIWVSLAILMLALWLNNSRQRRVAL